MAHSRPRRVRTLARQNSPVSGKGPSSRKGRARYRRRPTRRHRAPSGSASPGNSPAHTGRQSSGADTGSAAPPSSAPSPSVSCRDVDKFADFADVERSRNGLLYLTEHVNAMFSCTVKEVKNLGSHMMFIGEVTESKVLGKGAPCTYAHYHKAIRPKV